MSDGNSSEETGSSRPAPNTYQVIGSILHSARKAHEADLYISAQELMRVAVQLEAAKGRGNARDLARTLLNVHSAVNEEAGGNIALRDFSGEDGRPERYGAAGERLLSIAESIDMDGTERMAAFMLKAGLVSVDRMMEVPANLAAVRQANAEAAAEFEAAALEPTGTEG